MEYGAEESGTPEVREYLHGEHTLGEASSHWIITRDEKYIWYSQTGEEQYFWIAEDPDELHNLIGSETAKERVEALRGLLIQELQDREEGFVREGRLIGREHFHVTIGAEDTKKEVLSTFISQYYAGTPFVPKEIMLPMEIEDADVVAQWLSAKRGQKVYIRVPKKGQREKLVELAEQNAVMVLTQDKEKIRREEGRTIGAVKEIADLLEIGYVKRMEAYDISNTNGFESVGSMVVYERGKPCRSDYRKFKLKTVTGPDDYASMREVLTRRFTHGMEERVQNRQKDLAPEYGSFTKFPDLILMDGGKGQVNIALEVLDELKLAIPVCGMVKDDHHRTRGLYFNNEEIPIDRHSEGFRLITRIQDEAHRFAIEYHRSLRSKQQVHSVLDDIPNIGQTRRKALMRQFQSLEKIREATVEQLREVDGMNEKAARSVYEFFHKQ